MGARVLDGRAVAQQIQAELKGEIEARLAAGWPRPGLAAVLVGEDPASQVYVRNKHRACQRVGIESRLIHLPASASVDQLLQVIDQLNVDPEVHGILVQLPLPAGWPTRQVLDRIDPAKDVDAFSPVNVGRLVQGRPRFLPCTPHGVVQLLARSRVPTRGQHVVILGRSEIVGKPLANMLLQKDGPCGADWANATVTCCHSQSTQLADLCRSADILVAAIGQPRFVTADLVAPGAVVIDVGINRLGEELVGDVDYQPVAEIASAITPVPGGIGPLTISMLLANTLKAAIGE
jgi:methylenetetrahydrofolate dehydrogenase (NADP+) / methenyltetrahydrofolate cyclohydrolase